MCAMAVAQEPRPAQEGGQASGQAGGEVGGEAPELAQARAARVVAFVPDLMDRSKLDAAARAHGVALDVVNRPSDLVGSVAGGTSLVIVDLSRPGVLDAVRELCGLVEQVRILGFGSHVERDLLRSASETGCDQVMARSAFFTRLPSLLGGLGGVGSEPPPLP